ncbi:MAG: hypothetical protein JSV42_07545 [Chloroflexota bacterium]|nr:MAG: hypothetical protein JSV42_07545 [Chloroflexota bacterium]
MGDSIDLLILPLERTAGQDQSSVTGLHIASLPRKTARLRKRDRLILHLHLEGNAPLPPDRIEQLLSNLEKKYYQTAGTVTTALRTTAEQLNQYLLDRNVRNSSTGRQAIGYLTQIVLRDKRVSIAQSGLSHAYLLTSSNIEHVHDIQLAGNGLGLSRTTHLHFSQVDIQQNDALVISIQSPVNWGKESLANLQNQGPESLRRKLLSKAGTELNAFLIHAQAGSGELRLLRPVQKPRPIPVPVQPATTESHVEAEIPVQDAATVESISELGGTSLPSIPLEPTKTSPPSPDESPVTPLEVPEANQSTNKVVSEAEREDQSASIGGSLTDSALKIYAGLVAFLRGILPDSGILTLPPATMAFTAIVVPLTIVAVAAVVYFQRGREAQYNLHFTSAQQAAELAETKTDPHELRLAWEKALLHINNAELYQTTEESRLLHAKAQGILDDLNAIERLEFRIAIVDQLDENAQITRIVSKDESLYMLNASDGIVERAILTDDGFRLDTTFQCGPGPYEGMIVGPVIDIAPLPAGNEFQATLVGIDGNGTLLYCVPGDTPLASPMEPPDIMWGTPRSIVVEGSDLYVLDPQTNAVWIYRGMDVTQSPRLFFDQQIPPLHDVIDMEVNQNDLYLLHEDGHLTTCIYSALSTSPTRCKNPEIFTDPRPGRQSGPFIEDTFFSQIEFAPPPEPSIYLLDPNTQAIYRFSVRLTLDRQFRSQEPLPPQPASGFTINRSSHTIFLAIGNQIYYAPLP